MDLAGQSLSLVLDARFPGLGDQLRMQAGILMQCRFELLHEFLSFAFFGLGSC